MLEGQVSHQDELFWSMAEQLIKKNINATDRILGIKLMNNSLIKNP